MKIVIIDDHKSWHEIYKRDLNNKVDIIRVYTIEEAVPMIHDHRDVALVVIDDCMSSHVLNTTRLIKDIRKLFKGPLVGASCSEVYRTQMVNAGCNYAYKKSEVGEKVLEILSIKSQASSS